MWKVHCCLQIDDKGKVLEEITRKITDIAHVPVQTWKGWNPREVSGGWFSYLERFKALVGIVLPTPPWDLPPLTLPFAIIHEDNFQPL